VARRIV
jgi:hypothetical protein